MRRTVRVRSGAGGPFLLTPGKGVRSKRASARHTPLSDDFSEKAPRGRRATCDDHSVPDRFCRGRGDCFRASASRDAAWRATFADCRDGTASHDCPAGEPEPCSPQAREQAHACRDGAQAQVWEPRDAGPEARGARHAAQERDDSPHRPENPAAAECSRPEGKDNRWQRAELS